MAYKLQLVENKLGLNFNVKYENLSRYERPEVVAKSPSGSIVKEKSVYKGVVLGAGSTNRKWVDDQGNFYSKKDLKFYYNDQEVPENTQTKVLTIDGYQALKNYTDNYVIATYYELFPSTNDMKKDFDQNTARITNLNGMKRLWEHLTKENVVARGEFCPSSKGFVASDGYIRAVQFGNKWALELGVFKEEKIFQHLNEEVPAIPQTTPIKRLKMV